MAVGCCHHQSHFSPVASQFTTGVEHQTVTTSNRHPGRVVRYCSMMMKLAATHTAQHATENN